MNTEISRRGALSCLAFGGAGLLWTVSGGVPRLAHAASRGQFAFVQVTDSHIGFKADPNPNPSATLTEALSHIKDMADKPSLMIHTGDVTHLSKPEQFEEAHGILTAVKLDTYYVPGEHDVLGDQGKEYFARFGGKGAAPGGWYSFDQGGVHFVGLINVLNLKAGGLGYLGPEQLAWLKADLESRSASTPIVVFTHMPLWAAYPAWGWGTDDGDQAIALLKRFGSATVLNGHIHQVLQKVEGTVTLQTARSTAYPQAAAGTPGGGPGPLKVPADKLKSMLGIREVWVDTAKDSSSFNDSALA